MLYNLRLFSFTLIKITIESKKKQLKKVYFNRKKKLYIIYLLLTAVFIHLLYLMFIKM